MKVRFISVRFGSVSWNGGNDAEGGKTWKKPEEGGTRRRQKSEALWRAGARCGMRVLDGGERGREKNLGSSGFD